jgi:hypothetical protein
MQVFENDWMKRGGRFVPTMGKKSRTGFPMRLWVELWRRSLVAA